MSTSSKGPVLIDLDEAPRAAKAGATVRDRDTAIDPASAPPIIDDPAPQGAAVMAATRIAARPVSGLTKLFWAAVVALLGMMLTTAAWDFAVNLLGRNIWLGRVAIGLGVIVGVTLLLAAFREFAGFARLSRLDGYRKRADALRITASPEDALKFSGDLRRLYNNRPELEWAQANLSKTKGTVMDPDAVLDLTEAELMAPLDTAARREIEAAARQIATVTAIVPLALADVVVALSSNIRMVRRIAEIYGGRAGTLGSWRLMRAVATHLIATGAVGVADDMIGSVAGGGLAAKLSRRFGEGIINGALTARVGVAAMDVCRPMPFHARQQPGVTAIVKSALTGMFGKGTTS